MIPAMVVGGVRSHARHAARSAFNLRASSFSANHACSAWAVPFDGGEYRILAGVLRHGDESNGGTGCHGRCGRNAAIATRAWPRPGSSTTVSSNANC
jgi:hypothetical protein